MLFALIAAPLAWGFQTIAGMELARHACYRSVSPPGAGSSGLSVLLFGLAALTMTVAVAGLIAAIWAWRQLRNENAGDGHDLVDGGSGRTRFLALCAVILGAGFTAALGFSLIGLVLVPGC